MQLVERKRNLPQDLVRKYIYQAMYAVNYLHFVGITHRDIKLDNFLLSSVDESTADLKLIDFGFSKKYRTANLTTQVGSLWYIAPEILDKGKPYTQACDNWSLGVMLYIMLFAEPPFKGKNTSEILQIIEKTPLNFTDLKFSRLEPELCSLLAGLLNKDPAQRISLAQALHSPWFMPIYEELKFDWSRAVKTKITQKLRKVKSHTRFGREVVRIMVKEFFDYPEFKEYKTAFFLCDLLNNGVLTQAEIMQLYSEVGVVLSEPQVQQIVDNLYLKTKRVVTNTEFIAGILESSFFRDESRLKLAFSKFDIDNSGYITKENIKGCFGRFGYNLNEKTIEDMVKEFGADKDGHIKFDKFVQKMTKDR